MATFDEFEQRRRRRKSEEHEMAREQRGSDVCVYVDMYMYIIYNGTRKKNVRNKRQTITKF